jgi:hypothetical protein
MQQMKRSIKEDGDARKIKNKKIKEIIKNGRGKKKCENI